MNQPLQNNLHEQVASYWFSYANYSQIGHPKTKWHQQVNSYKCDLALEIIMDKFTFIYIFFS